MSSFRTLPALWSQRACEDTSLELWFGPEDYPEPESQRRWRHRRAKEFCASCPIQSWCLEDELRLPAYDQYGVRGGMTASERQKLLKQRAADQSKEVA